MKDNYSDALPQGEKEEPKAQTESGFWPPAPPESDPNLRNMIDRQIFPFAIKRQSRELVLKQSMETCGGTVEFDVPIPMRDGLKLAANVFRPKAPGKYPVIMTYTPHKDLYWQLGFPGWQKYYEPWSPTALGTASFEAPDPFFWVSSGYAFVIMDARGWSRSPGAGYWIEFAWRDYYDAIEWAGTQEWSNGNVGLSGVCGLAGTQLPPAGHKPPHLKAIRPWEPYMVSSSKEVDYDGLRVLGGIDRRLPIADALLEGFKHEPAWPAPEKEDPPEPDPRGYIEMLSDVEVPVFVAASWSSHGLLTYSAFEAWRHISSQDKWLYTHGRGKWASYYESENQVMEKMFFDHYLKGTDDRILSMSRVRLEVRENLRTWKVRWENEFPIARTRYESMYLNSKTASLTSEQVSEKSSVSYDATSDDSATFDYCFQEDTELTGYMKLKLWVAAEDFDDADLFIALRKFDQDGHEVRFEGYSTPEFSIVADAWMRVSYRELDEDLSTPWLPQHKMTTQEKVQPGEIVPVIIRIDPSSTLFRKGEKLRLEVSGVSRPGENLRIKYPSEKKGETVYDFKPLNKGKHTIHTGGQYDSYLQIPIVP